MMLDLRLFWCFQHFVAKHMYWFPDNQPCSLYSKHILFFYNFPPITLKVHFIFLQFSSFHCSVLCFKIFLLNLINDNRLRGQNIDGQGGSREAVCIICLKRLEVKLSPKLVERIQLFTETDACFWIVRKEVPWIDTLKSGLVVGLDLVGPGPPTFWWK